MPNAQESQKARPYFGFISVVLLVVAIVLLVVGIAVGMEMIRASGKIIHFNDKTRNAPVSSQVPDAK